MGSGLNTALIISLLLISGSLVFLVIFIIQILSIVRRILLKVELRIDNFALTQDEIRLKILNFLEEILTRIKNYGKKSIKAGEIKNEKTNKEKAD